MADFASATADATESDCKEVFDKNTENRAQNQGPNATNATNAALQTTLAGEQQEQTPDPSCTKTKCLKDLQETEQMRIKKSKSRLAEMAEVNLIGNDEGTRQEEHRQDRL